MLLALMSFWLRMAWGLYVQVDCGGSGSGIQWVGVKISHPSLFRHFSLDEIPPWP
jgi:hypothetical protein